MLLCVGSEDALLTTMSLLLVLLVVVVLAEICSHPLRHLRPLLLRCLRLSRRRLPLHSRWPRLLRSQRW